MTSKIDGVMRAAKNLRPAVSATITEINKLTREGSSAALMAQWGAMEAKVQEARRSAISARQEVRDLKRQFNEYTTRGAGAGPSTRPSFHSTAQTSRSHTASAPVTDNARFAATIKDAVVQGMQAAFRAQATITLSNARRGGGGAVTMPEMGMMQMPKGMSSENWYRNTFGLSANVVRQYTPGGAGATPPGGRFAAPGNGGQIHTVQAVTNVMRAIVTAPIVEAINSLNRTMAQTSRGQVNQGHVADIKQTPIIPQVVTPRPQRAQAGPSTTERMVRSNTAGGAPPPDMAGSAAHRTAISTMWGSPFESLAGQSRSSLVQSAFSKTKFSGVGPVKSEHLRSALVKQWNNIAQEIGNTEEFLFALGTQMATLRRGHQSGPARQIKSYLTAIQKGDDRAVRRLGGLGGLRVADIGQDPVAMANVVVGQMVSRTGMPGPADKARNRTANTSIRQVVDAAAERGAPDSSVAKMVDAELRRVSKRNDLTYGRNDRNLQTPIGKTSGTRQELGSYNDPVMSQAALALRSRLGTGAGQINPRNSSDYNRALAEQIASMGVVPREQLIGPRGGIVGPDRLRFMRSARVYRQDELARMREERGGTPAPAPAAAAATMAEPAPAPTTTRRAPITFEPMRRTNGTLDVEAVARNSALRAGMPADKIRGFTDFQEALGKGEKNLSELIPEGMARKYQSALFRMQVALARQTDETELTTQAMRKMRANLKSAFVGVRAQAAEPMANSVMDPDAIAAIGGSISSSPKSGAGRKQARADAKADAAANAWLAKNGVRMSAAGSRMSNIGAVDSSVNAPGGMGDRKTSLGMRWADAGVRAGLYGSAATMMYGGYQAASSSVGFMGNYDESMNKIQRVVNPLGANMKDISQSAREMGREFGTSLLDVASGMEIYAQQGKSAQEIMQQTRVAILATNVTTLSLKDATESLTAASMQFNIPASESIRILDSWNQVENSTAIDAERLTKALMKAGTAAKTSGINFDEFNGMVAAVGESTRKSGEELGTGLKFILQNVRTPQAIEALQNIGIYMQDAEGKMMSSRDALSQLKGSWDTLTQAQQQNVAIQIAGVRHSNDFFVLMERWNRAMDISVTSLMSQGSAMSENQIAMQSLNKQIEQLKAGWQGFLVTLGESGAVDALRRIVETGTLAVDVLGKVGSAGSSVFGGMSGATMAGGLGLAAVSMYSNWSQVSSLVHGGSILPDEGPDRGPARRRGRGGRGRRSGPSGPSMAMPSRGPVGAEMLADPEEAAAAAAEAEQIASAGRASRAARATAMRQLGYGSAMAIGGTMLKGATNYFMPDDGKTANAGRSGIDFAASAAQNFALPAMFYRPGKGMGGNKIAGGLGALAALTTVSDGIKSYQEYSNRKSGAKAADAKVAELDAMIEKVDSTSSDVRDTLEKLASGATVDSSKLNELKDRLTAISPEFTRIAASSTDLVQSLREGGSMLAAAQAALKDSKSQTIGAQLRKTLDSEDVQKRIAERDELTKKLATANTPAQRFDIHNQLQGLRSNLGGTYRGLQAMATYAGASGGGTSEILKDDLIGRVANANQMDRGQVGKDYLAGMIRAMPGGGTVNVDKLLGGADVEKALREGFVQVRDDGPIFRLYDQLEVARTKSEIEEFTSRLSESGNILLKAGTQLKGVPIANPEALGKLLTNVTQAANALVRRNQDLAEGTEWIAKNTLLAQRAVQGGDVVRSLGVNNAMASMRTLRDTQTNGFQGVDSIRLDPGSPRSMTQRLKELAGNLLQSSSNPSGTSLNGLLSVRNELFNNVVESQNMARRMAGAYVKTGGRDIEGFDREAGASFTPVREWLEKQLSSFDGPGSFSDFQQRVIQAQTLRKDGRPDDAKRYEESAINIAIDKVGLGTRDAIPRLQKDIRAELSRFTGLPNQAIESMGREFSFQRDIGQVKDVGQYMQGDSAKATVDMIKQLRGFVQSSLRGDQMRLLDMKSSGADDREVRAMEETIAALQSTFTTLDASLKDLPDRVYMFQAGLRDLNRDMEQVQSTAGMGGSYGYTGVRAQQFTMDKLRGAIEKISDRINSGSLSPDAGTGAIDRLARSMDQVRDAIASTQAQRAAVEEGAAQSALVDSISQRLGYQGPGGAAEFLQQQQTKVVESIGDLVGQFRGRMGNNDGQMRMFSDELVKRLGPLVGGMRANMMGADAGYSKDFMLSGPSEQALASQVMAMMRQGMSAQDVFGHPMMAQAAKDSPLLSRIMDTMLKSELEQPERIFEIQSQMLDYQKALPEIAKQMGEFLDRAGAVGAVDKAPRMASGSTALAGKHQSVDSMGRIKRNGTVAVLHEGEVVLNKRQSTEFLQNHFASGTAPNHGRPGRSATDTMYDLQKKASGLRMSDINFSDELGRGSNAAVYRINDDFVARVHHSVNERSGNHRFVPGKPGSFLDNPMFGQKLGTLGPVEILPYVPGRAAGVEPALRQSNAAMRSAADHQYLRKLQLAAAMPESSYLQLGQDIQSINKQGWAFDPSKSNNLLIDAKARRFNMVDLGKRGLPGSYNTMSEMASVLMDSSYAWQHQGNEQAVTALRKQILDKVIFASEALGEKNGFSGKTSPTMEYVKQLATRGVDKYNFAAEAPSERKPWGSVMSAAGGVGGDLFDKRLGVTTNNQRLLDPTSIKDLVAVEQSRRMLISRAEQFGMTPEQVRTALRNMSIGDMATPGSFGEAQMGRVGVFDRKGVPSLRYEGGRGSVIMGAVPDQRIGGNFMAGVLAEEVGHLLDRQHLEYLPHGLVGDKTQGMQAQVQKKLFDFLSNSKDPSVKLAMKTTLERYPDIAKALKTDPNFFTTTSKGGASAMSLTSEVLGKVMQLSMADGKNLSPELHKVMGSLFESGADLDSQLKYGIKTKSGRRAISVAEYDKSLQKNLSRVSSAIDDAHGMSGTGLGAWIEKARDFVKGGRPTTGPAMEWMNYDSWAQEKFGGPIKRSYPVGSGIEPTPGVGTSRATAMIGESVIYAGPAEAQKLLGYDAPKVARNTSTGARASWSDRLFNEAADRASAENFKRLSMTPAQRAVEARRQAMAQNAANNPADLAKLLNRELELQSRFSENRYGAADIQKDMRLVGDLSSQGLKPGTPAYKAWQRASVRLFNKGVDITKPMGGVGGGFAAMDAGASMYRPATSGTSRAANGAPPLLLEAGLGTGAPGSTSVGAEAFETASRRAAFTPGKSLWPGRFSRAWGGTLDRIKLGGNMLQGGAGRAAGMGLSGLGYAGMAFGAYHIGSTLLSGDSTADQRSTAMIGGLVLGGDPAMRLGAHGALRLEGSLLARSLSSQGRTVSSQAALRFLSSRPSLLGNAGRGALNLLQGTGWAGRAIPGLARFGGTSFGALGGSAALGFTSLGMQAPELARQFFGEGIQKRTGIDMSDRGVAGDYTKTLGAAGMVAAMQFGAPVVLAMDLATGGLGKKGSHHAETTRETADLLNQTRGGGMAEERSAIGRGYVNVGASMGNLMGGTMWGMGDYSYLTLYHDALQNESLTENSKTLSGLLNTPALMMVPPDAIKKLYDKNGGSGNSPFDPATQRIADINAMIRELGEDSSSRGAIPSMRAQIGEISKTYGSDAAVQYQQTLDAMVARRQGLVKTRDFLQSAQSTLAGGQKKSDLYFINEALKSNPAAYDKLMEDAGYKSYNRLVSFMTQAGMPVQKLGENVEREWKGLFRADPTQTVGGMLSTITGHNAGQFPDNPQLVAQYISEFNKSRESGSPLDAQNILWAKHFNAQDIAKATLEHKRQIGSVFEKLTPNEMTLANQQFAPLQGMGNAVDMLMRGDHKSYFGHYDEVRSALESLLADTTDGGRFTVPRYDGNADPELLGKSYGDLIGAMLPLDEKYQSLFQESQQTRGMLDGATQVIGGASSELQRAILRRLVEAGVSPESVLQSPPSTAEELLGMKVPDPGSLTGMRDRLEAAKANLGAQYTMRTGRLSDRARLDSLRIAARGKFAESDQQKSLYESFQATTGANGWAIRTNPDGSRTLSAGEHFDQFNDVTGSRRFAQEQENMFSEMRYLNSLVDAQPMAVGSMGLKGTKTVDGTGRIRDDNTPALLHKGEIVLNRHQADSMMGNALASGTTTDGDRVRAQQQAAYRKLLEENSNTSAGKRGSKAPPPPAPGPFYASKEEIEYNARLKNNFEKMSPEEQWKYQVDQGKKFKIDEDELLKTHVSRRASEATGRTVVAPMIPRLKREWAAPSEANNFQGHEQYTLPWFDPKSNRSRAAVWKPGEKAPVLPNDTNDEGVAALNRLLNKFPTWKTDEQNKPTARNAAGVASPYGTVPEAPASDSTGRGPKDVSQSIDTLTTDIRALVATMKEKGIGGGGEVKHSGQVTLEVGTSAQDFITKLTAALTGQPQAPVKGAVIPPPWQQNGK